MADPHEIALGQKLDELFAKFVADVKAADPRVARAFVYRDESIDGPRSTRLCSVCFERPQPDERA